MRRCPDYPFNDGITEGATEAQNLGCLPTKEEMVDMCKQKRVALSCRERQGEACGGGLAAVADVRGLPVIVYSSWYRGDK